MTSLVDIINTIDILNYSRLKSIILNSDLDLISEKILSHSHFWDYLENHYNSDSSIPQLQNFIKELYDIYNKCYLNSFDNNLKPIDKTTLLSIDTNDIYEKGGECFDINTIIHTLIPSEITNIVVEELTNIKDEDLSNEEKIKEIIEIDKTIQKQYPSFKQTLFIFLALAFIGIKSYILPVPNKSENYLKLGPLGSGGQGSVFKATSLDNKNIIIKELPIYTANNEIKNLLYLKKFNSKYFPIILDSYNSNDFYKAIVMEYDKNFISMDKLDYNYLKTNKNFLKKILTNILKGIKFLHSIDVSHNDLKPQNILVNPSTGEIKLNDFGSACIGECSHEIGRTPKYYDPYSDLINFEQDYYAFKIILMDILDTDDISYIEKYFDGLIRVNSLTPYKDRSDMVYYNIDYFNNNKIADNYYVTSKIKDNFNFYGKYQKGLYQKDDISYPVIINYVDTKIQSEILNANSNIGFLGDDFIANKLIDITTNLNQEIYISEELTDYSFHDTLPTNKIIDVLSIINDVHSKNLYIGEFDICIVDNDKSDNNIILILDRRFGNNKITDWKQSYLNKADNTIELLQHEDYYNYINIIYKTFVGKQIEPTSIPENGDLIYNYLEDSNYYKLIKPNLTPEIHFEDIIDKYFKKGGDEIIEKW